MFPICSSVFRYLPSLLSGFHGADFPPFYQYYEPACRSFSAGRGTKTAFALLLVFGFPRRRYRYDNTFVLNAYLVVLLTSIRLDDLFGVHPFLPHLRAETGGSPMFLCYPILPLMCFQTPVDSYQLVFIVGSIWSRQNEQSRHQHFASFRG